MVILNVLDPVHVETNKEGKIQLHHYLSYKATYWRGASAVEKATGDYKKKQKEYPVYMVKTLSDESHIFPTGFLPRAIAFLKKNDVPYKVTGGIVPVEYDKPGIPGLTFRPDQKRLIKAAILHGRGVLQAPCGFGKSITLLGIISAFKQEKILFLCHKTDLITQFKENLLKSGFTDIGVLSDGSKTTGRIELSTIQSFARLNPKNYVNKYDVILIDECHSVSSYEGQYGKILQRSLAPVRIGVTATLPYRDQAKFALEGLVGPLLKKITVQQGTEAGFIAKPIIKIIDVPNDEELEHSTNYRRVYQHGIVDNLTRNMLVVHAAKQQVNKKKSVLINVNRIDHGENLASLGAEWGLKCQFIHGSANSETRAKVKNALNSGKVKCVITSNIWKEGVDLPNLDVCINSAAGKSEIATLQALGRGLRATKTKKEVLIIDFKDSCSKYLRKHFKTRYRIYRENGWI